jgi:5-enolpyruvylshikimate-3-phosphate synthase
VWVTGGMGQRLFSPPSVAGWEWGPAWMSSNGMRMRFVAANVALSQPGLKVEDGDTPLDLSPREQLNRALAALGHPWASERTKQGLMSLAKGYNRMAGKEWQKQVAADMTQRAMRHLLLSAPDAQVH